MTEKALTEDDDSPIDAMERAVAAGQRRGCGPVVGDLTKRELFAAMIAGDLAASYAQGGDFMEKHVAAGAVKVADALLKELAK